MKAAHKKSSPSYLQHRDKETNTKNFFTFFSALDNQLEGNQSTTFGFLTTASPPTSQPLLPLVIVATTQELCSEIQPP